MDEQDELDAAVVQEAEDRLPDAEWLVFYYAYHCCADWSEIHALLVEDHGRTRLQQETVERYGRRASAEIITRLDAIKKRMK